MDARDVLSCSIVEHPLYILRIRCLTISKHEEKEVVALSSVIRVVCTTLVVSLKNMLSFLTVPLTEPVLSIVPHVTNLVAIRPSTLFTHAYVC